MNKQDRSDALAPETHNDEQRDEDSQAQTVAAQAQHQSTSSPTDSTKGDNSSDLLGDSTQDLIDHMRDMESSGRIDMDAYQGEPNMDDEDDKYGEGHDPDEA